MNVQEIFQRECTAMIVVSMSDLEAFGNALIEEAVARFAPPKEEVYLTVKQVSERLQVDRSTLHRWNKENYLNAIKIGNKSRYKLSDVERIMMA